MAQQRDARADAGTTARIAMRACRVLSAAGIHCLACGDLEEICKQASQGAAALMLPEEIINSDSIDRLSVMIRAQPVWSDLPVIVLSQAGTESPAVAKAMATLGNVSLIERPVRISTLVSMVRTLLRARERQYQVRDHLGDAAHRAGSCAEAAKRRKLRTLPRISFSPSSATSCARRSRRWS